MTSADEFNARQEKLVQEIEAKQAFLQHLATLADTATNPGPDKWTANADLMAWFRSDPAKVIEMAQAACAWALKPGGVTSQRLIQAAKNLQGAA